jgi:hypothetical protein
MPDYLNGEFHPWHGGRQPVPDGTLVHILLHSNVGWHDTIQLAEDCSWEHVSDFEDANIISFRVVKAPA